ncbi:MAG TPA: beta-ketoacyl-ACP synthase III [Nitrospiraceae bacterium]|nr:beta-ketoacyl-ACP synthase III [Nitrospiraceae bacterium]
MTMRSRIIATGSYVPMRIMTNEDVSGLLGVPAEGIFRRTGIRTRHWAADSECTSHLAEMAARRACEAAGVALGSADAIVVSTTSPDMAFPSTACHLQYRLGLKGSAAFDLAASCSGFLYGLSMADRLIRSGQVRRCLVVAAEIKSRSLDPRDTATAIIFGDGAGAALLDAEVSPANARGILDVRLYADGTRHALIRIPAGGSRQPTTRQTVEGGLHTLRMQGGPLFRVAIRRLATAVIDLLKEHGYTIEDVSRTIFHQANGRMLSALRRRLGLSSENVYSVIETFGNTSSASLPLALDHAVRNGHIKPGDLVLLGTFGGGLTWATGLVRW